MIYTIQCVSESGSLGDGKIQHVKSQAEISAALESWVELHDRVGSDSSLASVLAWRGHLEDVTDVYPDLEARFGPRGGFQFHEC